jgi:hypothetical protein
MSQNLLHIQLQLPVTQSKRGNENLPFLKLKIKDKEKIEVPLA